MAIARELLGTVLHTCINGVHTAGIITETEAYRGLDDKACHAHGRRTARTEVMYHTGGVAYVFLCYGIHHLFNIVTNQADQADAVLVRAIEPIKGVAHMLERRNMARLNKRLTTGPGTVCQAMGIDKGHYGASLQGPAVWLSHHTSYASNQLVATTRIGVDYAGNDALRPWRFYPAGCPWVSKPV